MRKKALFALVALLVATNAFAQEKFVPPDIAVPASTDFSEAEVRAKFKEERPACIKMAEAIPLKADQSPEERRRDQEELYIFCFVLVYANNNLPVIRDAPKAARN